MCVPLVHNSFNYQFRLSNCDFDVAFVLLGVETKPSKVKTKKKKRIFFVFMY